MIGLTRGPAAGTVTGCRHLIAGLLGLVVAMALNDDYLDGLQQQRERERERERPGGARPPVELREKEGLVRPACEHANATPLPYGLLQLDLRTE